LGVGVGLETDPWGRFVTLNAWFMVVVVVSGAITLHLLTVASLVVVYDTLILVTGVGEGGAVLLVGH
jgi:hypothetical protein